MNVSELPSLDKMNTELRSGIERDNAARPRPKPSAPPLPAGMYIVTRTDDPDVFEFKDGRKVRLEGEDAVVKQQFAPPFRGKPDCNEDTCCGYSGVTIAQVVVEPLAVTQFASGAIRGTEKNLRYDLISPHVLRSLAAVHDEGSKKYGDDNYLNGIPSDNLYNHLLEHLQMWQEGDTSEDHLGHALWNLATLIHFTKTRPDLIKPRIYAPDYVPQKAVVDGTRYTGVDHMAKPSVTDASLFGEDGVLVDYDGRKSDA